jgi:hypothetical protein
MPFQVRVTQGDDPRELAEKLSDSDAHETAKRVSAATGETVELVPYVYDQETKTWSLAAKPSTTITVSANAEPVPDDDAPDFAAMTGPELNEYAEKNSIEGYKKSAKVPERLGAVLAWFTAKPKDEPDATSIDDMTSDQLDAYAENLHIQDWNIDQDEDAKRAAITAFISA